ncbi:MAG: VanZ family protein [Lachnospiraceae bacterium]|nr:VanZ family protein [Lachnospiraceae bacterium]
MKKETKRTIRLLGRILFVLYIMALAYFLFLSEDYGRNAMVNLEYHYNLVPFKEIHRFWVYRAQVGFWVAFYNLAGNVIGFLPFGFILPVMHRDMKHFWLVVLLGFGLSLLVETLQLVLKVGCFDVDDLMLNTLGAAMGYLLFALCDKIRRVHHEKV